MNLAHIEGGRRSDPITAALAALAAAGIQYEVVCSGPEPFCTDLVPVAAA